MCPTQRETADTMINIAMSAQILRLALRRSARLISGETS